MTDQEDDRRRFGYLRMSPAEELTSRLDGGEFLTGIVIADFLRNTPPDDWPEQLALHVAGLLDGSIKARRGRPKNVDAGYESRLIQMIYPAVLRELQAEGQDFPDESDENLPEEFVASIGGLLGAKYDGLAKHEKAKAITSILVFGHDGHVKKVQEQYSSQK